MNQQEINKELEFNFSVNSLNPTHTDFNFELWSKAVRDQMVTKLKKSLTSNEDDYFSLTAHESF